MVALWLHPHNVQLHAVTHKALCYTSPSVGVRSVAITVFVCLSVCLFARISQQQLSSCCRDGRQTATVDVERKMGAAVPLFPGGAGFPSNAMSPGFRPISAPSGILIHPINRYRQTGQRGQRSRSIGRNVTSNGRPKTTCPNFTKFSVVIT